MLSHGNGLAVDMYYPFWSLLAEEFDLIFNDLRSYGWNKVGQLEGHSLVSFVEDQDAIVQAVDVPFGNKPWIGVFRSVPAFACLLSPNNDSAFAARILSTRPTGLRHSKRLITLAEIQRARRGCG